MPDKQVYEYAVIRYLPRVEREEFVNVGVILFCKRHRYLEVRYHLNESRLLAFDPELDLELLRDYLQNWEWISKGQKEGGEIAKLDLPSRFRWLTAVRSTIIQSSQVHPGMTDAPERVLERLFEQYVS
ncbi:MAG: DUF3037 domain-containing protein [Bacteroidota bacterium]